MKWLINVPQEYRYRVALLIRDLKVALDREQASLARLDSKLHISDLEGRSPVADPKYLLAGFWDHLRLENIALRLAELSDYEVEVEKEGSYDGLVTTCDALVVTPEGEKVILEFKTVGSDTWRKVVTSGPLEHHVNRLRVYLESYDASFGVLLYEFRDTLEWYPFVVERDKEKADAYVRRLKEKYAQVGESREGGQESTGSTEGSQDSA